SEKVLATFRDELHSLRTEADQAIVSGRAQVDEAVTRLAHATTEHSGAVEQAIAATVNQVASLRREAERAVGEANETLKLAVTAHVATFEEATAGSRAEIDHAVRGMANLITSLRQDAERAVSDANESLQQAVTAHVATIEEATAGSRAEIDDAVAGIANHMTTLRQDAERAVSEATAMIQQTVDGHVGTIAERTA